MIGLPTGLAIAGTEFVRGTGLFGLGRIFGVRQGSSVGRDFMALTLLAAIVIALIAFSITAGRGVSENITQIMVGHVPKAGTPIWVFANTGRDALDADILSGFKNHGGFDTARNQKAAAPGIHKGIGRLDFYPVTEMEMRDPLIQLPVLEAWQTKANPGEVPTEFRGWAVDRTNPVWAVNTPGPGSAFAVVLSRSLFEKHFDFSKYRAHMAEVLSTAELARVPETLSRVTELAEIYLSLPFDTTRRRLVPFQVIWADSLPGLQKISMLVPYEIITRSRTVWENPDLSLAFETDVDDFDEPFQILESMEFRGLGLASSRAFVDDAGRLENFDNLLACLGNGVTVNDESNSITLEFEHVTRWSAVDECLTASGLRQFPNLSPNFASYTGWQVSGRTVTAPCNSVRPYVRERDPDNRCWNADDTISFTPFPYFRSGLVFIPPGLDTISAVEDVLNFADERGAVFLVPETYKDALLRIDFTQKVIQYATSAVGALGIVLFIMVLFLQISPMLMGRRKTFGLLLARGLSWKAIYLGTFFQFAMVTFFAALIGACLTFALHFALESFFSSSAAAETARLRFGLSDPRFVPEATGGTSLISLLTNTIAGSLVITAASVAILMLIFAALILWQVPVRAGTVPVELIVGRPTETVNPEGERRKAA
jgi:hypothetical protein